MTEGLPRIPTKEERAADLFDRTLNNMLHDMQEAGTISEAEAWQIRDSAEEQKGPLVDLDVMDTIKAISSFVTNHEVVKGKRQGAVAEEPSN